MTEGVTTVTSNQSTVTEAGDTVLARQSAESLGGRVGFDEPAVAELGIVAVELATNVLNHAASGEITIAHISDDDREGIRIESFDAGPGIDDVDAAFADGVSTAGSLGSGLGAVNRLMDQVTVSAPGEPDYGTHVVADRWLRTEIDPSQPCPLDFGAASRPISHGEPNGDSFTITQWDDKALVGVIDGLGHGVDAHEAALAAKQYVERHYDASMATLFEGTERACRGTRGVVMALARFDWKEESITYGSVGNIRHKTHGPADLSVVQRRGVLGSNGPEPVVKTTPWDTGATLIMFSDGLTSHWSWSDHDDLLAEPASVIASGLLDRLGKDHDDATVLVVAERTDREGGADSP